jgi:DHA2 family multidrug resistance protein-like MFS transporter
VAVLFTFFGLAGLLLLLTQFLQLVQGHGPLEAGVRLLPLALAALVFAPLTDRVVRLVAPTSRSAAASRRRGRPRGARRLDAGTSYWLVAVSLVALGAGAGVASTAGSAAILASARPSGPGARRQCRRRRSSSAARLASRSSAPS